MKPLTTILIPTFDRPTALAATLTSLLYQTDRRFDIIISDQGKTSSIAAAPTFQTLQRIFQEKGITVTYLKHLPRKGIAEQRQFLLNQAVSSYILFLDDDLILDSFVLQVLHDTIKKEQIGFVGQAAIGLSFSWDIRPNEQNIEFWKKNVQPEKIRPGDQKWERYLLHNGANIYHVQKKLHLTSKNIKKYKVAWIGGCVMYDRKKLLDRGGFNFWGKLPKNHAGEDVLTQILVMEKYGGCAVLPSGVYHQELPTTISNRKVNAPEYLL